MKAISEFLPLMNFLPDTKLKVVSKASHVGRTEDIFTVEIREGNVYEKERRKPIVTETYQT